MTNELPPADIVGTRPAGEGPVGTLGLIRITLATLRFNFWRLLVITLYAESIGVGLSLLVCCPLGLALGGHPEWTKYLAWPLVLPIAIPLATGYAYAVLLQALGRRPKAKEVLHPIESGRLYLNVLGAAGLPTLATWIIYTAASQFPWPTAATLLPAHPLLGHFLKLFASQLPGFVALPFAFAGIDALVRRARFVHALARSLHFACRQQILFAGLIILNICFAVGASS